MKPKKFAAVFLTACLVSSCAGDSYGGGPNPGALLGAGAGAIIGHGDMSAITDGARNGRQFTSQTGGGNQPGQYQTPPLRQGGYTNSETGQAFNAAGLIFGQ